MKLGSVVYALTVITAGIVPIVVLQEDKALSAAELKAMVVGLGFTVKDLNTTEGKEKIEFTTDTATLKVPMGVEVSPSKRFIWLTVFLGDVPATGFEAKALGLLKQNGKIQPSQFYVTDKGRLMLAMGVDNRNLTPAVLKHRIDKVVQDVVDTKADWTQ